MDSIANCFGPGQFGLSFELFPPKTAEGMTALFKHADKLSAFEPSFMTCTYGAGGSTQDKTLEVIGQVRQKYQLPVATHLTCVGRTPDEIREYLDRAQALGVHSVVALRGDPPQGEESFKPVEGGFAYANELVEAVRGWFPECGIAVGGYPETHQEAPSPEADIENLKRKMDAGADVIITQLFYDNRDYFDFCERCAAAGIDAPIVPGLLPVTNLAQIKRIASLCGAKLPAEFQDGLEEHADDADAQFEIGVDFATRQTHELLEHGVPGIHFYVLNKSQATERVLNSVTVPARA